MLSGSYRQETNVVEISQHFEEYAIAYTIRCGICDEQICEGEANIEYVKTKRGTEIFVHRDCIGKW